MMLLKQIKVLCIHARTATVDNAEYQGEQTTLFKFDQHKYFRFWSRDEQIHYKALK